MKKVLATTMAGAMIFGMSSAAFAATALEIKPYNSGDYTFQIPLYVADGDSFVTGASDYTWTNDTAKAYSAFKSEYATFKNAADKGAAGFREYFIRRAEADKTNVADLYIVFYEAAKDDLKNTNIVSELNLLNPAGGIDDFENADIQSVLPGDATLTGWTAAAIQTAMKDHFNKVNPTAIDAKIASNSTNVSYGEGKYNFANKDKAEIAKNDFTLYNYSENDEINIRVDVKHGDSLRLDVNSGKITATRKKMDADKDKGVDVYKITIKPNWDVRDLVDDNDDLYSYTLEVDIESNDDEAKDPGTFYIKGKGAYSDFQEVEPDDRLQVTKSDKTPDNDRGCAFVFDQKLSSETRIKCNQYVDLYMKGNYGTDIENLCVLTDADEVKEIEDFFEDVDIDYYDFIGTPKFATEVTVLVDGDANSYIYEFDKKTGEIENITDSAEYTSDGWKFKRKNLKTYVLMEEEYNGGNVKADKEEVVEEEPEASEPEVSEPATDNVDTSVKPNPGTGAYPEF